PTCQLVAPVLARLAGETELTVFTQDDPAFPGGTHIVDDRSLEYSWHHGIETVPTLLRVRDGEIVGRAIGWQRDEWEALTASPGSARSSPPGGRAAGRCQSIPTARPSCSCASRARASARAAWSSPARRTSTRPSSRGAGPTACPSCRRPRSACWACAPAARA